MAPLDPGGTIARIVPNAISLSRIALAAAFVLWSEHRVAAVAILSAAGISDWLDGWAARRLGQQSTTGALLDPICDRVFAVTVLATLVVVHGLPLWQLAVLVARDVVNTLGALVVWWRRPAAVADLRALRSGKIVTSLQFWAAIHLVLGLPGFAVTLAAVAATTVWALVDYGARFWRLIGDAKSVSTP
jgi:CDP-diacylglycerol--glycerol-3-phosphate 3-phosphatidyltransferase/cardiolipin synthase